MGTRVRWPLGSITTNDAGAGAGAGGCANAGFGSI